MTEAVIVAGARTPIGRAHKGTLVDVDAFELGKVAVRAAVERSTVPPEDIDDLVLAESLQGGGVIARYVAIDLGLDSIPGLADNRHCAAGLSAVQIAAGSIRAGMDRVVVAGGTESLSSMVMGRKSIPASANDPQPWMSPANPPTPEAPPFDMVLTVGALDRAGLAIGDVDLFEINEAFCTMAVASSLALGIDHDIVNVNGSGCGLGHPIAATGARMVVSMLHELRRRELSLGCVAMCAGGGMGSALVVELL